jgi:CheY-like chemotaxis protein
MKEHLDTVHRSSRQAARGTSSKVKHTGENESDYVLVVDDDADARRIMCKIMEHIGLEVRTASDGEEALSHVQRAVPRLILLDILMPRMDGFEVLFRLRGNPRTRYIPVIVVSACSFGQEDMLKLPGVKHVIQKSAARITEVQAAVNDSLQIV